MTLQCWQQAVSERKRGRHRCCCCCTCGIFKMSGSSAAISAVLSLDDASRQAADLCLAAVMNVMGRVAVDERRECYARIMSTMRAVDISGTMDQAADVGATRTSTACAAAVTSAASVCRARRLVAL